MPTPRGRRPPPLLRGEGLVYRTIRLSKGDDRALPGLWGVEAEETGHSEESVWGGEIRSEEGARRGRGRDRNGKRERQRERKRGINGVKEK